MSKIEKESLIKVVKGTLFAIIINFILILLFSVFVYSFSLTDKTIKIVNQFIKMLSLFIASLIFIKEKGLVLGILSGFLFQILLTIIFSLFSAQSFVVFLIDLVFCLCLGGVFGIVSVNMKK